MNLFHEGRDVLIPILLKNIPENKIPLVLRHMLRKETYLRWPSDTNGQELFWRRLREELKKPSAVDRR